MIVTALLAGLTGALISALAVEDGSGLDTDRLNEPVLPVEEEIIEVIPEEEEIEDEGDGEAVVRPYNPLRPFTTCPADVETLTALLIRDIPNYANRVLQRSAGAIYGSEDKDDTEGNLLIQQPYRPSFVIVAGRPELEPLDLSDYTFTSDPTAGGPLTQLFFTTLSRQYSGDRYNEVEYYHWLFLAQAEEGWWLAFMFSRVDDPETPRGPTTPEESSSGSIGQAVQLWLKDCRAGAIESLE